MDRKVMQNGNLRIFIAIVTTVALPIYALAIFGCFNTSSGIPDIWMAEITCPPLTGALVHAGHFDICLVANTTTLCGNSAHAKPNNLATQFNAAQAEPLFEIALALQRKIILYFIVIGVVFYTIGACAAEENAVAISRQYFPFLAALAFTLAASLINT